MRTDEQGFTLVEMLVAVSIMVLIVAISLSVLMAAQRASKIGVARVDRVQVLRTGVRQIADDLRFAQWDFATQTDGQEFSVYGYLPEVARNDPDPLWDGLDPEWPGDAVGQSTEWPWPQVTIRYRLEETALVREVSSDYGLYRQEAVATGLIPWNSAGTGSFLTAEPGSHWVRVMLRTAQEQESGVSGVAEVYSLFYLLPAW